MNGFISITVVAIVAVSTLVLGGAGYGAYKYQEVQKENEQIKAELDQKKDKEIARLEEELNATKEEVDADDETKDEVVEEAVETTPEPTSSPAPTPAPEPAPAYIPPVNTEPEIAEATESVPTEPVTPTVDEYGLTEADWKAYDELSEDLESQKRDVRSLVRQLEKDIDDATEAKDSTLQTISSFPDSTVEYTGRAFVESARDYISAANKTISRGERYADTLNSIIDDIYNRDGSSLDYKFDQARERKNAYEDSFDETMVELEKYGGLLNEYLSLFNT